jgi:hypothetical protein
MAPEHDMVSYRVRAGIAWSEQEAKHFTRPPPMVMRTSSPEAMS